METIINQIFEISQKSEKSGEINLSRNIKRIYAELDEMGYQIINPIGRPYRETDSDIEANIAGSISRNSKIEKVLKPIIYKNESGSNVLIQKGIVIVG